MNTPEGSWGDLVLFEARACLEARMPAWMAAGTRIAVYAAGGHTRDLLLHPDFARLNLIGVLDRNPAAQGQRIGACEVIPPERIGELDAQVILISSPPHHEAILLENGDTWRAMGLEVLDLCEGAKPYAALFPLALKQGLVLDDSQSGVFRITRPGNPADSFVVGSAVWPYAADVINNFDYYFGSVEPDLVTPMERVVNASGPGYKVFRRSGLRLHFPSLPEPDCTTDIYVENSGLKEGDTVLDLGAYAGGSSLFFSRVVGPSGRVLAVEPDRVNLKSLRINIKDHGLNNVQVEPAAVWIQDGETAFESEGCMGSSLAEVLDRNIEIIRVQTFTLETLLTRHGIDQVHFIKMDIEGAEFPVLEQAMPLLQRLKPRMVIEPHYVNGELNASAIQDLLSKGGFLSHLIHQGDDSGHPLISARWEPR